MGSLGAWLGFISTILGIIGSMAGAVTWISKKNEERMGKSIKDALTPLTYELRDLNNNLNDSKEDRIKIHCELDEHDKRIDNHDTRITVLEKYR